MTNPLEAALPTWAYRMRVDAAAARALDALAGAGVPAILLKGSTLDDLYNDRQPRLYVDVDVLVPSDRLHDAEAVLGRMAYAPTASMTDTGGLMSSPWVGDGLVPIDLHVSFHGIRVESRYVWRALANHLERHTVSNVDCFRLDPVGRALFVALHAGVAGRLFGVALEDLRRALADYSESTWVGALLLAERLHATTGMVVGLSLTPEGETMTRQLGLSRPRAHASVVAPTLRPSPEQSLAFVLGATGWRAKARGAARTLVPPIGDLASKGQMPTRGILRTSRAYTKRIFRVAVLAPGASIRFMRASRRRRTGPLS